MKKTFLFTAMIAAALFSTLSSKAQDVKGKHFINAGIGIGTFGFSGTGGLPVTASYEHGFTDKISADEFDEVFGHGGSSRRGLVFRL